METISSNYVYYFLQPCAVLPSATIILLYTIIMLPMSPAMLKSAKMNVRIWYYTRKIGKASDTAVGPPGPGVKGGDTDAAEVIRLIYARREKSQYRVHPRSTVVVRAAAVREPLLEPSSQQYYVSPPYWDLMSHLCSILDPICQAAARRHHSSLDRGHWTST